MHVRVVWAGATDYTIYSSTNRARGEIPVVRRCSGKRGAGEVWDRKGARKGLRGSRVGAARVIRRNRMVGLVIGEA